MVLPCDSVQSGRNRPFSLLIYQQPVIDRKTGQHSLSLRNFMADQLKQELKELIVETLHLEDVQPEQIPDDEPLFGGGLDLDSIDALELVVQLEKTYGIKLGSSEESMKALGSINILADYIRERAPKA